jgi:multicomponent Na+:H+ antiporter subunit D
VSADVLVPLVIAAPLAGAALCLVLAGSLVAQRAVAVASVATALVLATAVLIGVERDGTAAVQLGGWAAPIGITLVADLFALLLLVVALVTLLAVLVFAIGQLGVEVERRYFHTLYLVLTAGVVSSFLTGDLFNLFVAFEVMLIASYVLLTVTTGREVLRPAMTYVVVSLLASTLFITAVALLYAATGTVNMADLAQRTAELPPGLQLAFSLLFLVVFGIKAALFPLFFWLPDSYPVAPAPITAIFAGLLTKVGVYAIIRVQTIVFGGGDVAGPSTLVLFLAGTTMLVGVLGAIAQDDMKRILSFHIVSQIGYMILGLGLYTVAGLAGATLFIVHQIPVKTSLFLVGGMVEKATGTNRLASIGGLVRRMPVAATLFLLAALSLAGLPPFSGFFGKLALVQAGFAAERWVITGVALGGSILTLFSMTKIWAGAFWGASTASEPELDPEVAPALVGAAGSADGKPAAVPTADDGADPESRLAVPRIMTGAAVSLVAVTLAIALFAEPIHGLSVRAAEGLLDPAVYRSAVLGEGT